MVAPRSINTITDITRRTIADWFTLSETPWMGNMTEAAFVGRVFDLAKLPSNDGRCSDMAEDVASHRDYWNDWGGIGWVFDDTRLDLMHCPDEKFMAFLCETVHPRVRPEAAARKKIVDVLNEHLRPDGWQLVIASEISGRPIYAPRQGARPLIFEEPIGWAKVDRQMAKVKTALAAAKTDEDFQGVGLLCREVLISAAQEAHDPKKHPSLDGTEVSNTDAKRMLEAVIAVELVGEANEEVRGLMKHAMKAALALQHKRGADHRTAALCAEGTLAVVAMVVILTGRRDRTPPPPEPVGSATNDYARFDNEIPF